MHSSSSVKFHINADSIETGSYEPTNPDTTITRQPLDDDDNDILYDLPTDEGIGDTYGLQEIPGGIGIDSCASDNVMHRDMLPGYKVRPSNGSRRGQ